GNGKRETGNGKRETGNGKRETGNGKRLYFVFLETSSVNTFLIKILYLYTLNEYLSIPKAKRSRLSKRSVLYQTKRADAMSTLSNLNRLNYKPAAANT
ncbi:hypothetical protein, partial [Vibrio owensii]|uniref:hypothetical protein n=1 Tax=Vibrio owensii TaxID=696485 RepID=UPI003AAB7BED